MITIRRFLVPAIGVAAGTLFLAMAVSQQKSGRSQVNAAFHLARTLTHPTTSTKAPDEEGFIRRWLVLEPIRADGLTQSVVQATVRKEYFPKQFGVIPHDGDGVFPFNYVVLIPGERRDAAFDWLAERGIGCAVQFAPCHCQPLYAPFQTSLPVTERSWRSGICARHESRTYNSVELALSPSIPL